MRMTYTRILKSILAAITITLMFGTHSFASAYRNSYLSGTMPWHRSFRDVNLCTGNVMKSFTDIQVAPARGAGLVLQRTYNSNDERIGPFGRGWTHAYEIRMEEIESVPDPSDPDAEDNAVRTDFFGGKHKYTRDADGLYTPPPYMHDWTVSDYNEVLEVGPGDVNQDIEIGLDGTEKHFVADGNERICDYIKDRNGNTTTLEYTTYTIKQGVTKELLTTVTDPSGRELNFNWEPMTPSDSSDYRYRITAAVGPLQTVTYDYWRTTDQDYATYGGGEPYNLKSVTLDPNGLNRTTIYGYSYYTGTTGTAYGLLSRIADPLQHVTTYEYDAEGLYMNPTGTVWVMKITESGGVDQNNNPRTSAWDFAYGLSTDFRGFEYEGDEGETRHGVYVVVDDKLRAQAVCTRNGRWYPYLYYWEYDSANNPTMRCIAKPMNCDSGIEYGWEEHNYTYGRHGNVLTHSILGFPGQESFEYWTEDKYFQKKSATDMNGNVTTFDYGDRYGLLGERGNLLLVRDAKHQPDGKTFTYEYNQYGQKISEINLNDVLTTFEYADDWGNLTQVVQDPGVGHLNRTTDMVYDQAGRVTVRTDPNGRTSTVEYNTLGQPEEVFFPATSNTPSETVSYGYGDNGRLEGVTDNRGTTGITYENGCDRVSSVTDPITGTISYKYTRRGSVATKALPSGETFNYTYNTVQSLSPEDLCCYGMLASDDPNSFTDLLANVKDDSGHIISKCWDYSYTGGEKYNIKYQSNNEISYCTTDYSYEGVSIEGDFQNRGLISGIVNKFHWWNGNAWQEKVLSKNEYEYDDLGNRTVNRVYGENDTLLHTETYDYDKLNRLKYVDYGEGSPQTQTYTFDNMGNRLTLSSTTYDYNAANMLTTINGQPYAAYDANGNQLTGGGRTNIWDSQNRLASCTYSNVTSAFMYGSDGLRRSMTVGNDPTVYYALDGQSVAQEGYLDNGIFVPDVTYFTGPRGVEYREDTNGVSWYLYDGLGSVVAEVDVDGDITATRKYDTYGAVRGSTGTGGDQLFCGKLGHQQEPATGPTNAGLIYMRARWMDPITGRFISEDPVRDGANWYIYAANNPVNLFDFTGKIAGFDDWLNEEAEDGAASLEAKNAFTQKIENAVMDWYDKLIRNVVGDCENMTMESGSRGNFRWIFQKGGKPYQIRLDLSGHGGSACHWNFDWMAHSAAGHSAALSEELMQAAALLGF